MPARLPALLLLAAIGADAGALGAQRAPVAVPPDAAPIAITGVTVIDVAGGRRLADRTVVVRQGRIAAVDSGPGAVVPAGARRVDGRGRFLLPGLWDVHVHFMNTGEGALPLLVANGVTGVREMGGFLDSTRSWQRRMAAGTLVGPRIVTPGPILESPQYLARVRERDAGLGGRLAPRLLPYRIGVGDTAEARRAVDSLVALGVDFVKVRNAGSREAWLGILDAAHRRGLRVAGHLPSGVALGDAAEAGQDDVEHLWTPPASMSADDRTALYARVAARGTWYAPTLVVSDWQLRPLAEVRAELDDSSGARAPRRYASPWLLGWWRLQYEEQARDTLAPRRQALQREGYRVGAAELRRMRDAGVRILAGTDAGSVLTYPGPSLHRELQLLVTDGGLTPQEALWSATVGPAELLGLADELGSVAPGRLADLVLLDADPLADVRNTTSIRAVVANGRLLERAALDAMLEAVASSVRR
jgi:imidazolonepropionase-like amidohydrolase